ncbi:MAG: hypothetical protein RQ748_00765 [Elusimicrobiales bacterium]|nr:hypothetical protein [Elusimicrobiales bacterium]
MNRRPFPQFAALSGPLPPLLLGAAACAAVLPRAWLRFSEASFAERFASGSFLLAGFPSGSVNFEMPFAGALVSAVSNLGPGLFAAAALLHTLICFLVYRAAALAAGRTAGVWALAVLAALEFAGFSYGVYDFEQVVYSFFLLLTLCAILEARDGKVFSGAKAGLAIGMSALVRPPLFFFPPVFIGADLAAGGRWGRRFLLRAAAFAAAAYILLVPWGALNRWLDGRFSMVSRIGAESNVIAGALGAVYTLEGDARELAGLPPGRSAESFFFERILAEPGAYGAAVLRRLWHTLLFNPVLFGAFLAALFLNRRRELLPALALPVFFVLLHCAFAVERRYFYPMGYVMPPLITAVLVRRFRRGSTAVPGRSRLFDAVFSLAIAAALAVNGLVLAYPRRALASAADPLSAAAGFPGDRALRAAACGAQLDISGHSAFLACLGDYSRDFPDGGIGCALSAARGAGAGEDSLPGRGDAPLYCLSAEMFRALETGRPEDAAALYARAMAFYRDCCAMLRGEPYARDRELGAALREQTGRFWERYAAGAISLWPPEKRPALLAALRGDFDPPPGFSGDSPEWPFKEPSFNPAALAAGRPDPSRWAEVPASRSALAKEFSDSAVEALRAGRVSEAEAGLREALAADPFFPEALVNLCWLQSSSGRDLEAADSCGKAFCSVYSAPGRQKPGLQGLASAAAEERYRLLVRAGRRAEAELFMRGVEEHLPPGWPKPASAERPEAGRTVLRGLLMPRPVENPCARLAPAGEPGV